MTIKDYKGEITKAAQRIAPYIVRTPCTTSQSFAPYPIEIKWEQMQHTGSFKTRGAFNSLLSLDIPDAGIVAASGGNHGAAAAYAASQLGYRAKIFVPEFAGPAKIDVIKRAGADLTVVGGTYANALAAAQEYEAETGAAQIHAYDADATVIGQGTLFAEWAAQGLVADTILIAVGGGGLIAGALAWFGSTKKIIAVESETTGTLHAALQAGPETAIEVSGIAANALGARQIGRRCYDLAKEHSTPSILVPDTEIADAQKALWQSHRQFVEPAGAAALAALLSGQYKPAKNERVAVLVCGANPSEDPFLT